MGGVALQGTNRQVNDREVRMWEDHLWTTRRSLAPASRAFTLVEVMIWSFILAVTVAMFWAFWVPSEYVREGTEARVAAQVQLHRDLLETIRVVRRGALRWDMSRISFESSIIEEPPTGRTRPGRGR